MTQGSAIESSVTGTAWVASLSQEHSDNWVICREAGLWGTPNARGRNIHAGDEIYVWKSKEGWIARCIAISDAYPVSTTRPAPWTDGADYKWLMDVSVVAEAEPPIWLDSPGGTQNQTGLHTTTFRALTTIDPTAADAVRGLFPNTPSALGVGPLVAATEPDTGWGRSQDRERNKLIEQAGVNETIRYYTDRQYVLTGDRQKDGVGYDIELTKQSHTLKVEAKGIAGRDLVFNLTAKELEMAGTDVDFRLCAVTDALGDPIVTVLTGVELLAMAITPTQYRVRR